MIRGVPVDRIDTELITALRAEARASYAELGRRVGLSGPSVQDRVRRLEASGTLRGYHAAVDPVAVGLDVTALVGIYLSDNAVQDDVAGRLADVDAIEDCWSVAGDEAFMIKVRVGDVVALEVTLGRLRRIRGIARTRTTVVLSTRWEGRAAPLPS
jgi:Lrp/AsnC family transcriptional regulator, leucine-responsive regulatory protein